MLIIFCMGYAIGAVSSLLVVGLVQVGHRMRQAPGPELEHAAVADR